MIGIAEWGFLVPSDYAPAFQVRKGFKLDHDTITALAEQEQAGSAGVNFLPFLTGERTPNWPHSFGVLTGLRPGSVRPGLLYRAALEGATFSLLNGEAPSRVLSDSMLVPCCKDPAKGGSPLERRHVDLELLC
jgi:hypothetical protein